LDENSIYSEKQTRRDFLNYILGFGFLGWLIAVLYPIYSYLKPPKAPEVDVSNLKLGKVEDFPKDSGKIFKMGNQPGLLIRLPDGKFRAFDAVCTHLSCTVQYKPDEKIIWCACHNGKYDLNGKNISGPPPAPLTPYKVSIKSDEVFVSK
jgi:cytochrome b6-f complex iron-sulfur subunit